MAKQKSTFFCQNCGTQHSKWLGQCNNCGNWNTVVEEILEKKEQKPLWETSENPKIAQKAIPIKEICTEKVPRILTKNKELDNVLGGGIVMGSVILIAGAPGIGKSTLLLQIALQIPQKVLYVSGEESQSQIKMRADRIIQKNQNCYVLSATKTQDIFQIIKKESPQVLILDSIQTLHSEVLPASAGSISQIKQSCAEFIHFAKQTQIPVFIIGHINKDGYIAGPKVLEHMVDVVLHFEGDKNYLHRILRCQKNRFGTTDALGIYQMNEQGLQEINNPSEVLVGIKNENFSGTAIATTIEGRRLFLVEVQALVSGAIYGTPQRSVTGYDLKRLHMILAVLEKKIGFKLASKDVFLNITGGIRVEDPAMDLAVVVAILSSYEDKAIPKENTFAAEIGLSGEIRPVQKIIQRIMEAEKLGYQKIFISKHNAIKSKKFKIKIQEVSKIQEIYKMLF